MKSITSQNHLTAGILAISASFLLFQVGADAATYSYHVDINTASLGTSGTAPFYLDMQFSDGGGATGNNTISLSNFTYLGTGGGVIGSASVFDTATGDFSSGATLTDSLSIAEIYQQFSSTTTAIGFDVTTTLNIDPGLTPDLFTVGILDSSLGFPAQITTNSPDTLTLLSGEISNTSYAMVSSFSGTGAYSGVAAVPEPSTLSVFALGVLGLVARRKRRAQA